MRLACAPSQLQITIEAILIVAGAHMCHHRLCDGQGATSESVNFSTITARLVDTNFNVSNCAGISTVTLSRVINRPEMVEEVSR